MSRIPYLSAFAVLPLVFLSACSIPNGQPQKGSEPVAPNQVVDFGTLYAQNCSACHGAEGRGGASIALANPVYLAVVDGKAAHNAVTNGVRGTSMPAFAESAGGLLTDEQINVIALGTQGNSQRSKSPFIRCNNDGRCRTW
jgi:mono/diheme cytochrome c family protein